MSGISGDDEDALSDSSKLYSQTTARQTIKSTLVLQMMHSKSFDNYGLWYEHIQFHSILTYTRAVNIMAFKWLILHAHLTAKAS